MNYVEADKHKVTEPSICTVPETYQLFFQEEVLMLKFSGITNYFGYVIGTIFLLFGIIIISGLAFQYIPVHLRVMFGVVLLLWGVYRIVMTKTRILRRLNDEEENHETP